MVSNIESLKTKNGILCKQSCKLTCAVKLEWSNASSIDTRKDLCDCLVLIRAHNNVYLLTFFIDRLINILIKLKRPLKLYVCYLGYQVGHVEIPGKSLLNSNKIFIRLDTK